MVKKKKRFTMQLLPKDAALFKKAKAKTGLLNQSEVVRLALRRLARGIKK